MLGGFTISHTLGSFQLTSTLMRPTQFGPCTCSSCVLQVCEEEGAGGDVRQAVMLDLLVQVRVVVGSAWSSDSSRQLLP